MGLPFAERHPEKQEETFMGASKRVRYPRPDHALYNVGEVVKQISTERCGVIIGWDKTVMAPDSFFWEHPTYKNNENVPCYVILFNVEDDQDVGVQDYVIQFDLTVPESNVQINNPRIKDYFSGYEYGRYVLLPETQKMYPEDMAPVR